MRETHHSKAGFTFVELCIVVMVMGVMIAGFLAGYMVYAQKQRYDITRERTAALQYALESYVLTNKRLPCPADPTIAMMGAGVGKEVSCAAGASAPSGVQVIGSGTNTIWKGAVPAATLRMSSDSAVDGWGNRFTYIVSRKLTEPNGQAVPAGQVDRPYGVIKIVTDSGEDVVEPGKLARFLILSSGPTGNGAFTPQGVQRAIPTGTKEAENYDDNDTFVMAALTRKEGNTFYDDILIHDEVVKGTPDPRDPIAVCNGKGMFFAPSSVNPAPDSDGCVGIATPPECGANQYLTYTGGQYSCKALPNATIPSCSVGQTLGSTNNTLTCVDPPAGTISGFCGDTEEPIATGGMAIMVRPAFDKRRVVEPAYWQYPYGSYPITHNYLMGKEMFVGCKCRAGWTRVLASIDNEGYDSGEGSFQPVPVRSYVCMKN